MKPTRIIIFAKAPIPGRVKTRLIPALGAAGAASLARYMLLRTLDTALAAAIGQVELCMTPRSDNLAWGGFFLPLGTQVSDQGRGDLGARMARAARRALTQNGRVLLIGTDCLQRSCLHLRRAAEALDTHDAAIYPAFDGGYTLLGLRYFHPRVFEDIPWSTSAVTELTLARMQELHCRVWIGDLLPDIDEPGDLVHLSAHLGSPGIFHTGEGNTQ